MRHRAFFFVCTFVLCFLAGCKDVTPIGGTPPPKTYRTAVSLSPGAAELITSKLTNVSLVGRTAACNWPVTNTNIPVVMKGVKPNYEQIAQLRPAIVVYDDLLFTNAAEIDKFKELGIDTFAVTGNSIEEFEKCIYKLGRTFHSESVCSEYVDNIEAAISAAKGAPPAKKLKVAVLMPGSGSEHYIAGSDSFVADVIRKSQGEFVGPKGDRFLPASAENLVSLNPDVIISAGLGKSIENDPRLQSIVAVKTKRVMSVDPDILLRRGARVNSLIRGIYDILSETARN